MHIYMDDTCARREGSEAPLEISYSPIGSYWRIRMCHGTHSRMWYDSLKCVTSLIHV